MNYFYIPNRAGLSLSTPKNDYYMKVYISIRVRNSEWYWSKEKMKEHGDYRPDFEMINEGKIEKHIPTVEFDFNFEVKEYQEAEENTF